MRDDWSPSPGTRVVIRCDPECEEQLSSHGFYTFINEKTGQIVEFTRPLMNGSHSIVVELDKPIEYYPGKFQHFQYFAFHELQPAS